MQIEEAVAKGELQYHEHCTSCGQRKFEFEKLSASYKAEPMCSDCRYDKKVKAGQQALLAAICAAGHEMELDPGTGGWICCECHNVEDFLY